MIRAALKDADMKNDPRFLGALVSGAATVCCQFVKASFCCGKK
nr:conotoxin precursor T [Conus judaeus]